MGMLFFNSFIFDCPGLCCCTQVFSSFEEQGLFFAVVCWLIIAVASLAVGHRL